MIVCIFGPFFRQIPNLFLKGVPIMLRYLALISLFVGLVFFTYRSALAAKDPNPPPVAYFGLDGVLPLGLCGDQTPAQLEDIEAYHGVRWWYQLKAPNNQAQAELVVQFVCLSPHTQQVVVFYEHHEPWACLPTGSIGFANQAMIFNGKEQLDCMGRNLKTTVEALLPHLDVNLKPAYSVTDVFAEASVTPKFDQPQCLKNSSMSLFDDLNVIYTLQRKNKTSGQVGFRNMFGLSYDFESFSSRVRFDNVSIVRTERDSFGSEPRSIVHTVNGIRVGSSTLSVGQTFELSTTTNHFTVGKQYCGQIKSVIADPFARIH